MAKKITDGELKEYYENNPDITHDAIAEHFGVTQSCITKRINKLYGNKDSRSPNKLERTWRTPM